jgi:hypothetical protein
LGVYILNFELFLFVFLFDVFNEFLSGSLSSDNILFKLSISSFLSNVSLVYFFISKSSSKLKSSTLNTSSKSCAGAGKAGMSLSKLFKGESGECASNLRSELSKF